MNVQELIAKLSTYNPMSTVEIHVDRAHAIVVVEDDEQDYYVTYDIASLASFSPDSPNGEDRCPLVIELGDTQHA